MNPKRLTSSISAAVGVFMLSCGLAEASPITIGFAFEATDSSGFVGTSPPVDIVSGTVSFTFEDGLSSFPSLPPDAVNLTIAGFMYDVSTTTVHVEPGVFVIGGTSDGALAMHALSDDFTLTISRLGPERYFAYTVPFANDIYSASTVSVTTFIPEPIPEPGSLILLALGICAGLATRRLRHRGKAPLAP